MAMWCVCATHESGYDNQPYVNSTDDTPLLMKTEISVVAIFVTFLFRVLEVLSMHVLILFHGDRRSKVEL